MRIGAGIVLFNPDIERLKQNIEAIADQVIEVIVVDNHSDNINDIKKLILLFKNLILIQNDENYGIAHALNQIFVKAEELQYEWILTLDQDTICDDKMVKKLSENLSIPKLGIICPEVNYEGWSSKSISGDRILEIEACMTSGAMTNVGAWKEIGGFEESYFIDYVDNEFCMKLKLNRFRIIRDMSCIMNHQLGESGEIKVLFFRIKYSKHSPQRCYYMIRNNMAYIKNYRCHINVIREFCRLFYIAFTNVFFSDEKRKVLSMMKLGYKDFKTGKMGKLDM